MFKLALPVEPLCDGEGETVGKGERSEGKGGKKCLKKKPKRFILTGMQGILTETHEKRTGKSLDIMKI